MRSRDVPGLFSLALVPLALLGVLLSDSVSAETETRWVNGRAVLVSSAGGLRVSAVLLKPGQCESTLSDLQLGVEVVNETTSPVTFWPEQIATTAVVRRGEGEERIPLKTYTAQEVEKRIRRWNGLGNALDSLSAALDDGPEPKQSQVSGTYSERNYANGANVNGRYNGTVTTYPSDAEKAEAKKEKDDQLAARRADLESKVNALSAVLARTQTIEPGGSYHGIVHFKKKKADEYLVTVPIGKEAFEFKLSPPQR